MSDELRLTILGCGSSPGVPRVNGDWGACDPEEPRNRRRRCSALVERISARGTTTLVIDCGPDFREQMLSARVRHIDGVFLTHPHADHIHGLDDIRSYVLDARRLVPLYADRSTADRVMEAFGYVLATPPGSNYPPIVRHVEIEAGRAFAVDGAGGPIEIVPLLQKHGSIYSLGLRMGPFAYCSDVSDFPQQAVEAISGASYLIIDALQYERHPSHLSLDEALNWIERLGVPQSVLTHMHTPLDYRTLLATLPPHVRPAYDGLTITVQLAD